MKKEIKVSLIILLIVLLIVGIIGGIIVRNNKNNNQLKIIVNKIERVSEYYNPIVPEGFKKVETESASWVTDENGKVKGWNNGLVIEDENGNQFVWIPVYDKYKDKEYIVSDDEEEIQLFKYGGFYVSRYECGVPQELQNTLNGISSATNDIIGKPVSKKNIKPWNYVSYYNANKSAKLMYNTEKVKSDLLSLSKSEIIVDWIKNCGYNVNDSSSWGNYSNTVFRFNGLYSADKGNNYQLGSNVLKDDNMILATGVIDRNMANNIYDFAGNLREYTNTQFENTEYYYSIGGYYARPSNGNSGGSASEQYCYSNEPSGTTGFRVCLNLFNK